MCGIAGVFQPELPAEQSNLEATAASMAARLRHRGPDDAGVWADAPCGVALAHQRLAIIDLSSQGRQPMASASGRYQIVFNGEIYNHRGLRRELENEGHTFRGHADTEVLVQAIDAWGIEAALQRLNGMFAFAVWDARQHRLTLVRDRLGVKPLYYGWMGRTLLFGSELKALRAHPAFDAEVDRGALTLLLQHGYIPAPHSIYRGIYKLPPGAMLSVEANSNHNRTTPTHYWRLDEIAERGSRQPFAGSVEEAADELERLLQDSVRLRMEADVPVGAFLSGGIDSSLVVALMQAESSQPVRSFSLGFHEPGYDEAPYAKAVAEHLRTEHVEHYVRSREARDVIPLLPAMFDEPFADASQIPTYLVSKIAREQVTVSLSGDGGDELFGGYRRYAHIAAIWNKLRWAPTPVRRLAASCAAMLGSRRADALSGVAQVKSVAELYVELHSHWKDPASVVLGGSRPTTVFDQPRQWGGRAAGIENMMQLDGQTYLPDDILTKVDRASMAVSLEARVPLLDHRVVEFAWSLPWGFKSRPGRPKWLLQEVLGRHAPRALFERPKVGFGVPLAAWLRGPLREWAHDLLATERLQSEGYFQPKAVQEKWDEHTAAAHDWSYWLWDVLMFQAWLAEQTP